MRTSPATRAAQAALSCSGIKVLRSPPDDDADDDDWETIDPDPAELDEWDETPSDDDLDFGADEDEDEGDEWRDDEWPDFDRADDDE